MVTNRVYKVLGSTGVVAANLAGVTAGKYLIIDQTGAAYTAGEAQFQIVVGAPDGTRLFSGLINLKDVTSIAKTAYTAEVQQVSTITPLTPIAGYEYNVAIIDNSDRELLIRRQAKKLYSVLAVTGETATTLVAKFVALINADSGSVVVASGSTTLVLTAISIDTVADTAGGYPEQIAFDAFMEQLAYPVVGQVYSTFSQSGGTTVLTTAPTYGSGTYNVLKSLEDSALGYEGSTNRILFPVQTAYTTLTVGQTYDTYIFEYNDIHNTNIVNVGKWSSPRSVILALYAGTGGPLETQFPTFVTV